MKQINYCLPIVKTYKKEVLVTILKHLSDYQYFEIWLDGIEDIDDIFINNITELLEERLIVLFHRGMHKKTRLDLSSRLKILDLLHGTKGLLDLDRSEIEEIKHVQTHKINIKIIISYHNYKETPNDFSDIMTEMETCNPAIYKIATMCTSEHDALRLLQLQLFFKNQQKKHIILGMGEFGTITRVYGTLWGNEMIYAPQTKEESSAPGQLTKSELEKIFDTLSS